MVSTISQTVFDSGRNSVANIILYVYVCEFTKYFYSGVCSAAQLQRHSP